ncbi:MAG: hypothetical protein ACRDQ5_21370 [Sciscionella sp.]
MDSHADTCCAGSTTRVIEYTGKSCDVQPFADHYEAMTDVPIVKAGTAYDDPNTGITYILVISQALYFGLKLTHSLLCPNQMRANGVIVDDVPRHLSQNMKSSHSIYFLEEKVGIPLQLHGCLSYIPTRTPTIKELEDCEWLQLTADMEWDPYSTDFARQEELAIERDVTILQPNRNILSHSSHNTVQCPISSVLSSVSTSLVDDNMINSLMEKIMIRDISSAKSKLRKPLVTKEDLSRRWGIGLETATQTLKVTTQKCIRNAVHPLHRRYRTKQQQLRYNQLSSRFYSDTMFSKHKSVLSNSCGQIFVNDLEFARFVPMKSKSEAGDALAEFIQDVGIPSALHTDNAKEETLGRWKDVRLSNQIKQTEAESYTPWHNRAERTIKEVKKSVVRIMSRTKAPKRLWDFCATYVCETRCLTDHHIFSLHDRTPHEHVTGNTPDISEYNEFDWYQPIWYYDSADFPDEKRIIGRWLGVAHRIGQAMCYWILTKTGVPIARSTVQLITDDELSTDDVRHKIEIFDTNIQEKIGSEFASSQK